MARAEVRSLPPHRVAPTPPNLVVTTPDELRELVREAVAEALPISEPAPALLDRRGLAAALGCCIDVIDKLRLEGMPTVRLLDVPRFELPDVLRWLRDRP